MQRDFPFQSSDLVLCGSVLASAVADVCIITFSDEINLIVPPQSQALELRSFAS
jgi:hypothetical protein